MTDEVEDVDFGRGFLTPKDRHYLMADEEELDLTPESEIQKRYRIRERTRNALRDFRILYEYLSDEDRDLVLQPTADDEGEAQIQQMRIDRGIICTLAVIYESIGEEALEGHLQEAITHAIAGVRAPGETHHAFEGVDVTLDVQDYERVNLGALADKLHDEGIAELTNPEISVLLRLISITGGQIPKSREQFLDLAEEAKQEWDLPEGADVSRTQLIVREVLFADVDPEAELGE